MKLINRNVTIVIIILVLVVIAGYLVWLRSQFQTPLLPQVQETITATPELTPTIIASPSAQASPSATPRAGVKTPTLSPAAR